MFAAAREAELPVVEVDFSRIGEQADAIARLVDGSLAGVIVRGVFDPMHVGELVRRLERDGSSLPTFHPPVFKGRVYGRPLVSASDGLNAYLDEAERFRTGCAALFDEYPRMEQRLHDALAALGGGRPVSIPLGAGGRPYLAATIRVLIEGDRLPLHYENETLRSPVMEALRPLLDTSTLMSFYVPLATSRSGGILRLFRVHCLDGGDSLISRLGGDERALPYFEERGFSVVLPGIGDLLVFDGGRWYHDVTPVEGGRRWTLGGFLAATRDHRAVHYWS
jgi:hypothetical protein